LLQSIGIGTGAAEILLQALAMFAMIGRGRQMFRINQLKM